MIENKDIQLKFRVTPTEKEKIMEYCGAHDLSVSEFLRLATAQLLNKEAHHASSKLENGVC